MIKYFKYLIENIDYLQGPKTVKSFIDDSLEEWSQSRGGGEDWSGVKDDTNYLSQEHEKY